MTGPWRIEDAEPSRTPVGMAVEGSWVSIHYLRSCLRRRWRFVLSTTTAGLMLALAALTLLPASSSADATVFLAHDTGADPMTAIATDHKLLVNRTVAGQVVDQLNLPMTVDEFLVTYSASEPSTELLDIQLEAGSPQEAVRRLTALCAVFLQFRNDQLATQAQYIITTDQSHIAALRKQVDLVNQQYTAALAHRDHPAATQALTDRGELLQQIGTLQSTIEDTQLQSGSLATASHVVDPPAPVPAGGLKHKVLAVISGLILGCGLGVGIVFAHALISNRLRRREEIATALGRAVPFSAGPVHGRLPWHIPVHLPGVERRRKRNLEILSDGLAEALAEDRGARARVALVGVGDLRAAASVCVEAGLRLQVEGDRVFLVDLTNAGWLDRYQSDELPILRPEVRAGSASAALSVVASMSDVLPPGDPREEQWKRASLVLVLAEVDLGVGNRQLTTWADSAVLMVGAGKATAEYLRSISRLFASAGPPLEFAMVVGADRTDESLGVPRPEAREEPQRRARS
jgi:capsular polysaccharide biosynthesis protein